MSDENLGSNSSDAQGEADKGVDDGLEPGDGVDAGESDDADEDEAAKLKKARLEDALRKYRAILRNEAETGNEGFSADYYQSQKPPHW